MISLPAAVGAISKHHGVLRALYDDLASPGAKQVGKALETVLKTGNIVLLPLRLLNEFTAAHERRNFAEIAERFRAIADDDVIDVRPEIGVPIVEKLSMTEAAELRRLFIELLASAADKNKVQTAHPSFVRVIESLSPDEARILEDWKGKGLIPCLSISQRHAGMSASTLYDVIYDAAVDDVPHNILSAYISNMAGLGLLTHRTDAWVAKHNAYDDLIQLASQTFPGIKDGSMMLSLNSDVKIGEGEFFYNRECIQLGTYGKLFQECCVP